MEYVIEAGRFIDSVPEDIIVQRAFVQNIAVDTPDARRVSCNFIQPGSTVVAAHIADVPPVPLFDYIAVIETDGAPTAQLLQPSSRARNVSRFVAAREQTLPAELGAQADESLAVRQLCFIKRREGMSHGEFVAYYETVHAPLACKHLPQIALYNRYFFERDSNPFAFDVITEICFRTDADYAGFKDALADPVIGGIFAADEACLFDRQSISMVTVSCVEVYRSDLASA